MSVQTSTNNPTSVKPNCDLFNKFAAGAIAGATSAVIAQPFDRIKTSSHLTTPAKPIMRVLSEILQARGTIGLFDGMPASVTAATVHRTAKFSVQSMADDALKDRVGNIHIKNLLSGAAEGFAQGLCATPFEVVKVQVMKKDSKYTSSWEAYKSIRESQGLRGLTKGIDACIARDVIWNMGYFTIAPHIQTKVSELRGESIPSPSTQIISGAFGGMFSSLLNCPIDVAKSNIQAHNTGRNLLEELGHIATHQGVKALYRGLSAKLLSITPAGAVMWTVNNAAKRYLDNSNPCEEVKKLSKYLAPNKQPVTTQKDSFDWNRPTN